MLVTAMLNPSHPYPSRFERERNSIERERESCEMMLVVVVLESEQRGGDGVRGGRGGGV
ncbi:hypothetical protein HanRHA438_Chr02g0083841 [Helianthus annuus]|nr:hypothetical protein HanRHA438_Chr02g0083841 [Helianthus annuus]KAJ0952248.1 hypothetical protein HanPSC8_Chr02g0069991 [Helianthus annuus]